MHGFLTNSTTPIQPPTPKPPPAPHPPKKCQENRDRIAKEKEDAKKQKVTRKRPASSMSMSVAQVAPCDGGISDVFSEFRGCHLPAIKHAKNGRFFLQHSGNVGDIPEFLMTRRATSKNLVITPMAEDPA